jgi:hypothetical protein
VRKLPKGWPESWVEVELVNQLTQAHERNDKRKVRRVEADSSRLIWADCQRGPHLTPT